MLAGHELSLAGTIDCMWWSEHVSIVSFDDSELSTRLRPRLTTVAIPHVELGRCAVELLLGGERGARVHRIPMPLRERTSVAAPVPR